MRKYWILSIMLIAVLLVASGCGQKSGQPLNQSTPIEDVNQGVGENDIDPATPATSIAPVVTEPSESIPAKITKKTTLFFADKELNAMYRVTKSITADTEAELPKAALEAWIKGPEKTELVSLVPPGVVVESLEIKDGVAFVSFSSELKNANLGSGGEMYLLDQVALIMNQFGYSKTQILIEGKVEETLLGHVSIDSPLTPSDSMQYKWMD